MMFSTKLYCFNELKKLLFETPNFFINKLLVTHHRTTQRINCGIYRVNLPAKIGKNPETTKYFGIY